MFVVQADGRPAPTIVYGYGGFNVTIAVHRMVWIEAGGVYTSVNLRVESLAKAV